MVFHVKLVPILTLRFLIETFTPLTSVLIYFQPAVFNGAECKSQNGARAVLQSTPVTVKVNQRRNSMNSDNLQAPTT